MLDNGSGDQDIWVTVQAYKSSNKIRMTTSVILSNITITAHPDCSIRIQQINIGVHSITAKVAIYKFTKIW